MKIWSGLLFFYLALILALPVNCNSGSGHLDPAADSGNDLSVDASEFDTPEDAGNLDGESDVSANDASDGGDDSGVGDSTADISPDLWIDCPSSVAPAPGIVNTNYGAVAGVTSGNSWAYKGIPYATSPEGERRWKPPIPHDCWDNTFAANQYGTVCPQSKGQSGQVEGAEDCLTLNIWVPKNATSAELLPVLFFIHGGGNVQGSSSETIAGLQLFDGRFLAEKANVVVVTINYRVGILGFLTHPLLAVESEHAVSGNYGLLDQILALEWTYLNITAFNGDPSRILVFGQSAGALNTCAIVSSPLAKGFFSAAIMESGACHAISKTSAEEFGNTVVQAAGCADSPDIIACMRGLSSDEVVRAYPFTVNVAGKPSLNHPNIDGYVLMDYPNTVIKQGLHNPVPMIIGCTSKETAPFVTEDMDEPAFAAAVLVFVGGDPETQGLVLAQYSCTEYGTCKKAFITLTSDSKFVCTSRRDARAAATGQTEPVFRYWFTHTGLLSEASHGAELLFVFARNLPLQEDKDLSKAIYQYWTELAATGTLNGVNPVFWPPYDLDHDYYLELSHSILEADGIRTLQCDFWDTIDIF